LLVTERRKIGESDWPTAKSLEQRVDARRWIKLEREDNAIAKRDLMLNHKAENNPEQRQIQNQRVQVEIWQEISQVSLQGQRD
jgi:hypothetical protein